MACRPHYLTQRPTLGETLGYWAGRRARTKAHKGGHVFECRLCGVTDELVVLPTSCGHSKRSYGLAPSGMSPATGDQGQGP